MVDTYWQIVELSVNEEQQGKLRAEYRRHLIREFLLEMGKSFAFVPR